MNPQLLSSQSAQIKTIFSDFLTLENSKLWRHILLSEVLLFTLGIRVGRLCSWKWLYISLSPSFKG